MAPDQILDRELLRFTFCGTIIASFFAVLVAGGTIKEIISPAGEQIATTVLALSAVSSFSYLLCVASFLKYRSIGRVDQFIITRKVAGFFYDAGVNVFGIYFFVLLAQFILVRLLHITSIWWLIVGYLFGSGLIYLIALLAWAAIRRLIEAVYDVRH